MKYEGGVTMIDEEDKRIYFQFSFNEQMSLVNVEVKHIIKYKRQGKISNEGEPGYNKIEYTNVVKRLFDIIKADPKNKALLREVDRAEKELIAYLYDEQGALSEEEIFTYWNNYKWAHMAELECEPVRYFLMRGYTEFHDGDEWIGIYDSLSKLKEAYDKAKEELDKEHAEYEPRGGYTTLNEKVMINIFNEAIGKWQYDVSPEEIFDNNSVGENYELS